MQEIFITWALFLFSIRNAAKRPSKKLLPNCGVWEGTAPRPTLAIGFGAPTTINCSMHDYSFLKQNCV
jgi:hypothetical protein